MKEISLNILDIAENSVRAGASLITVSVEEDTAADTLTVEVEDNGCGMSPEMLARVRDPFTTTRTTRKVGLGLPLLQEAAQATGGGLEITSREGVGTRVRAVFGRSHIDRMPLGDLASTVATLVQCNDDRDFVFRYVWNGKTFIMDTRELRTVLDGVSLNEPEVVQWVREYIRQNTTETNGGNEA